MLKREHPSALQILIHRFSITQYHLLVNFLWIAATKNWERYWEESEPGRHFNIKYKTRSRLNRNDFDLVVKFLKKEGNSSVNIIVDEEENFKGHCYQDVEHVYEVSIQTNF